MVIILTRVKASNDIVENLEGRLNNYFWRGTRLFETGVPDVKYFASHDKFR